MYKSISVRVAFLVGAAALGLTACGNPYALKTTDLNFTAIQEAALIQFSDPKLFPREHLINERIEEVTFLKAALLNCNTLKLKPELVREVEVVRSLALGLGLNFDPVAADALAGEQQIADLKNDIAVTRLEMELAQLKRDAQLLDAQLAAQVVPSDSDGNGTDGAKPTTSIKGPSASEIEALVDNIDTVTDKLREELRKTTMVSAAAGEEGGSPIDTFNHQRACRASVKAALNAANLDTLHDHDGAALLRFHLTATVLPGAVDYNDTLGILRMEVKRPNFEEDEAALVEVYRNWLNYVNLQINLPPDTTVPLARQRIRTNPRFAPLGFLFDTIFVEVPKIKDDTRPLVLDGQSDKGTCGDIKKEELNTQECWYIRVALPRGASTQVLNVSAFPDRVAGELSEVAEALRKDRVAHQSGLLDTSDAGIGTCDLDALPATFGEVAKLSAPQSELNQAVNIVKFFPYVAASLDAVEQGLAPELGDGISRSFRTFEDFSFLRLPVVAHSLVGEAEALGRSCREAIGLGTALDLPAGFRASLRGAEQRVAVYDVAPSERVQPISTAARAADAISLAASIAGTLPSAGLGVSGNVAFSRSALGKADALELAPIVVGFSEPAFERPIPKKDKDGNPTDEIERYETTASGFGWLLGPKVIIDPKDQALEFVHPVKPYELFADVSLPGWWPSITIETSTAWAPNWQTAGDNFGRTLETNHSLDRRIVIPRAPTLGDMEGLTDVLLKQLNLPSLAHPTLREIRPSEVSACDDAIEFQIIGPNVWRASTVHVAGKVLTNVKDTEGSIPAVRVLPDMSGILVSIAPQDLPLRRESVAPVVVWTPDGRAYHEIRFFDQITAADDSKCTTGTAASTPKTPVLESITPAKVSACGEAERFDLTGRNLAGATVVVGGFDVGAVVESPSKQGLSFSLAPKEITRISNGEASVVVETPGGRKSIALRFSDRRDDDGECAAPIAAPTLASLTNAALSSCSDAEVVVVMSGTNLRTVQRVLVGGQSLADGKFLPNASGTSLSLAIMPSTVPIVDGRTAKVQVFGAGGDAEATLTFGDARGAGGACTVDTTPIVTSVLPGTLNRCRATATVRILGENLEGLNSQTKCNTGIFRSCNGKAVQSA